MFPLQECPLPILAPYTPDLIVVDCFPSIVKTNYLNPMLPLCYTHQAIFILFLLLFEKYYCRLDSCIFIFMFETLLFVKKFTLLARMT